MSTVAINNLSITKERVKAWSACTDGYRWFLKKFPKGAEFAEVYAALREDKRYSDSGWLLDHVFSELDAPAKVQQTVLIDGADKDKIEAAADAGAEAATTGEGANAATNGEVAIAASLGFAARAKASEGGAIVLAHRRPNGELVGVFASMVGHNGIKPDVWYEMSDAGPVEVSE